MHVTHYYLLASVWDDEMVFSTYGLDIVLPHIFKHLAPSVPPSLPTPLIFKASITIFHSALTQLASSRKKEYTYVTHLIRSIPIYIYKNNSQHFCWPVALLCKLSHVPSNHIRMDLILEFCLFHWSLCLFLWCYSCTLSMIGLFNREFSLSLVFFLGVLGYSTSFKLPYKIQN